MVDDVEATDFRGRKGMDPRVKAEDAAWRRQTVRDIPPITYPGLEFTERLITPTAVDVTDGLHAFLSSAVQEGEVDDRSPSQRVCDLFVVLTQKNTDFIPLQAVDVEGGEQPNVRAFMLFARDPANDVRTNLRAKLGKHLVVKPKDRVVDAMVGDLNLDRPPEDAAYLELVSVSPRPDVEPTTAYISIRPADDPQREFTEGGKELLRGVFGGMEGVNLHGLGESASE